MVTNYLKPQEPLKKIDKDTGDINYLYPLVTSDQVILEDGTRLNAAIEDLRNNSGGTADKIMMASGLSLEQTLGGIWISFTDEDGNPTDEPYMHWLVDSETGAAVTTATNAEDGEY